MGDTNVPFSETLNPSPERMGELRDIFMGKVVPKGPIIDAEQVNKHMEHVLEKRFDWSASSCLVLLAFALAAIWGNYPKSERRLVSTEGGIKQYTVAVPEKRLKESLIYFSMAQSRMSTVFVDENSLLGPTCFCLFGCV